MAGFTENTLKLTEEELIFMNSVTKGPVPFGVFLKYPVWKDTEDLKEEIVRSLQKKGILNEERKITEFGMIPLIMWEEYRNAVHHMVLNQTCFAVLPNGRLIGIRNTGKEYWLSTGRGEEILLELLQKNRFLRGGENEREHYTSRRLTYDEWSRLMHEKDYHMLIAGSYVNYKPEKETAYYWDEEEGYQYDLNKGRERRLRPRQMRMRLMELLNVREGGQVKDE